MEICVEGNMTDLRNGERNIIQSNTALDGEMHELNEAKIVRGQECMPAAIRR